MPREQIGIRLLPPALWRPHIDSRRYPAGPSLGPNELQMFAIPYRVSSSVITQGTLQASRLTDIMPLLTQLSTGFSPPYRLNTLTGEGHETCQETCSSPFSRVCSHR